MSAITAPAPYAPKKGYKKSTGRRPAQNKRPVPAGRDIRTRRRTPRRKGMPLAADRSFSACRTHGSSVPGIVIPMTGRAQLCRKTDRTDMRSPPAKGPAAGCFFPLASPYKGRRIAADKTEGSSCPTPFLRPPASLRSAPSLIQGGQGGEPASVRHIPPRLL